jgi:phospholipase C
MFDHVPQPVPPAGTRGEFVDGLPIGLGFRVPAIVVSPWSVGGYVRWPSQNQAVSLAAAEASFLTAQQQVFDNPRPTIPAVNEPVPGQ